MQTDINFLSSVIPVMVGSGIGISISIVGIHYIRTREKRRLWRDAIFGFSIWLGCTCNAITRDIFPALKERLALGCLIAALVAVICIAPYLTWDYLSRSKASKAAA